MWHVPGVDGDDEGGDRADPEGPGPRRHRSGLGRLSPPFPVVLFDLDGTLSDNFVGIAGAWAHACRRLGLPAVSDEQVRAFMGPPLQDVALTLGVAPEGVAAAVDCYREYYADRGCLENELYEGLDRVLSELARVGVRLALATSKAHVFATRILEHFDLLASFEHVVGPELDGTRRHKDEVVAEALRRLGVAPEGAVLVGDRSHDVEGAAANGLPCIGVTWGYGSREELTVAGAHAVVDTPDELLRLLLGDPPTSALS